MWEETEEYIRSGHRSPDDFEKDSLRTITISEEEGIKAVVGKLKGEDATTVQSYLFAKDKGWTLDKAKAWFEEHKPVKEHIHAVLPFQVIEKIVDKPLKIRGVAMTAGMSRNFNIYTPEELQAFASKLVSAPVYIEHVSVDKAVGKVTKTEWDGQFLWYEAEIYESEVADKIRKGLVQHVSVGADYETLDIVDGKVPHGLHNAELSLVAVPGIPETNISVLEALARGQPGEYLVSVCTPCGDKASVAQAAAEFFIGLDPGKGKDFSALVVVEKVGDRFFFREQSHSAPASVSASSNTQRGVENLGKERKWEKKTVEGKLRFLEILQQLKEQGLSKVEVEAKLSELTKERDALYQELEAIDAAIQQASDAEREKQSGRLSEINAKLDLLWAEISAYQEVLANLISAGEVESLRKELGDANTALTDTATKLKDAEKTVEDLRKQLPGGGLLKDPPKTIPISEAIGILEGLLPSPAVERSTLGMQRECQAIRNAIFKLKEQTKSG